jgi:uncharacterized membrane protein YcaP (DUF421 family)
MFDELSNAVVNAFGIGRDPLDLGPGQVALRATVVYVFGLAAVRLADKRLLGKNTAFDVVVGVVLGSVLSRAINGTGQLFATMTGVAVLLVMHWVLAFASARSRALSVLLKGKPRPLVLDGQILWAEMQRNHISAGDLDEMLRLRGRLTEPEEVGIACLERNGEISAIPRRREPRVVDLGVRDGVHTVRVELGTS